MSTDIITAAWTDPIFRSELSEEDRVSLPDNPAGRLSVLTQDPTMQNYYPTQTDCNITHYSHSPCCF